MRDTRISLLKTCFHASFTYVLLLPTHGPQNQIPTLYTLSFLYILQRVYHDCCSQYYNFPFTQTYDNIVAIDGL